MLYLCTYINKNKFLKIFLQTHRDMYSLFSFPSKLSCNALQEHESPSLAHTSNAVQFFISIPLYLSATSIHLLESPNNKHLLQIYEI